MASEVIFVYLKVGTGKSILTLKKKPRIVKSFDKTSCYKLLGLFKFLEVNEFVYRVSRGFMDEYGLLPNDALILATCKFYGLDHLASLDSDFEDACVGEGVSLVNGLEKLKSIKGTGNH